MTLPCSTKTCAPCSASSGASTSLCRRGPAVCLSSASPGPRSEAAAEIECVLSLSGAAKTPLLSPTAAFRLLLWRYTYTATIRARRSYNDQLYWSPSALTQMLPVQGTLTATTNHCRRKCGRHYYDQRLWSLRPTWPLPGRRVHVRTFSAHWLGKQVPARTSSVHWLGNQAPARGCPLRLSSACPQHASDRLHAFCVTAPVQCAGFSPNRKHAVSSSFNNVNCATINTTSNMASLATLPTPSQVE